MQAKMFIHLITCMIPPVWGCSTSCSPDAGQNASDSFNEDSSIDGRSWRWFGAGKTRRGVIITNRLDHWRYHAWKGRCTDTFTVLRMYIDICMYKDANRQVILCSIGLHPLWGCWPKKLRLNICAGPVTRPINAEEAKCYGWPDGPTYLNIDY